MKTRTILIISALVALTGCGNAAHWGSSSSSQRFEDGIYRKVETVNRETRDSIRFETDALASKTRETQLYLKKGQSDTIFVPENKAAHIVLQDNYNALTIPTETITLSPWYYSTTWAYGMYRPWYYSDWYTWRSWDPWFWSSWSWNPWYWDSWYWGSWHWNSWHTWDPWYWSSWYWDPWYSPWHSPWHSSFYYGWHSPYYPGWHGGWYGGWHGGYGHRDISYGPRNRTMGSSRSAASRGGAGPAVHQPFVIHPVLRPARPVRCIAFFAQQYLAFFGFRHQP